MQCYNESEWNWKNLDLYVRTGQMSAWISLAFNPELLSRLLHKGRNFPSLSVAMDRRLRTSSSHRAPKILEGVHLTQRYAIHCHSNRGLVIANLHHLGLTGVYPHPTFMGGVIDSFDQLVQLSSRAAYLRFVTRLPPIRKPPSKPSNACRMSTSAMMLKRYGESEHHWRTPRSTRKYSLLERPRRTFDFWSLYRDLISLTSWGANPMSSIPFHNFLCDTVSKAFSKSMKQR